MNYHVFEITKNSKKEISVIEADYFDEACVKYVSGQIKYHFEFPADHHTGETRCFWEYTEHDDFRLICSYKDLCEYLGVDMLSKYLSSKQGKLLGYFCDCFTLELTRYVEETKTNISKPIKFPFTPCEFEFVLRQLSDGEE